VTRHHELERLLRWYPATWRGRYGEEFLALFEDCLDGASPTLRFRLLNAVSGVRERAYESGVVGERAPLATQRRNGALIALMAWSIMVIGGASFAKMAEHSSTVLPLATRSVARWAYDTTVVAGIAGTLIVMVGALIALPGFVHFLRAGGWTSVRRKFTQAFAATVTTALATIGVSAWAHHLNSLQRNGGDRWYSWAFLGYALLMAAAIFLWTNATAATVVRMDFSARALRWESWLALGVALSTMVVVASTSTWWIQMGLHAPWFLQGTRAGVSASPWSPHLAVTALTMIVAMGTALWGAWRVALTYVPARVDTFVIGGRGGT